LPNVYNLKSLTLCWRWHWSHWKSLCTLNNCMQPICTHFWHPVLRWYVSLFASRSFVTSQLLINCYLWYLSAKWHGPITFPCFWSAIDSM
jgi:hypothetical protein